jgi:gas vesicle protein
MADDRGGNGAGFMVGLMAGALVGVGLGMLLAPKSGAALREDLGTRAREAGDKLKEQYRHAGESATAWAERGREVAERGRVAVDRGREAVARGVDEARRFAKAGADGVEQAPKL